MGPGPVVILCHARRAGRRNDLEDLMNLEQAIHALCRKKFLWCKSYLQDVVLTWCFLPVSWQEDRVRDSPPQLIVNFYINKVCSTFRGFVCELNIKLNFETEEIGNFGCNLFGFVIRRVIGWDTRTELGRDVAITGRRFMVSWPWTVVIRQIWRADNLTGRTITGN